MSLHEYQESQEIGARDYPFYALIMAAFRQADTDNLGKLRCAFPLTWLELVKRYDAPGGLLEEDRHQGMQKVFKHMYGPEEEPLPETIMGMPVKVFEVCPKPMILTLGSFNDYDYRSEEEKELDAEFRKQMEAKKEGSSAVDTYHADTQLENLLVSLQSEEQDGTDDPSD